jgi:hypothetical protein
LAVADTRASGKFLWYTLMIGSVAISVRKAIGVVIASANTAPAYRTVSIVSGGAIGCARVSVVATGDTATDILAERNARIGRVATSTRRALTIAAARCVVAELRLTGLIRRGALSVEVAVLGV